MGTSVIYNSPLPSLILVHLLFRFRGDSSSSGSYRGETINRLSTPSGVGEGARRIPTPVREGPRRITTPVGGGGGDGGGRRMTNPVDNHVRRMISSGSKIRIKTLDGERGY